MAVDPDSVRASEEETDRGRGKDQFLLHVAWFSCTERDGLRMEHMEFMTTEGAKMGASTGTPTSFHWFQHGKLADGVHVVYHG